MAKPLTAEQKNDWLQRIQKQQTSGLSIQKWCKENQIPIHAFYYWKKRLTPTPPFNRSHFTELVAPKACTVTMEFQDTRIHIESSTLKQCLSLLEELC